MKAKVAVLVAGERTCQTRMKLRTRAVSLGKTLIPVSDSRGRRDYEPIMSWEITFPKSVLAQFNTHRVFSRNATSSRAIPTRRVMRDMAVFSPTEWRLNNAGMQSNAEAGPIKTLYFKMLWVMARGINKILARMFMLGDNIPWLMKKARHTRWEYILAGAHKEIVNRLLEPYSFAVVIASTSEWQNFYRLRIDKHAQKEIREPAELMRMTETSAVPAISRVHLPMFAPMEMALMVEQTLQDQAKTKEMIDTYIATFRKNLKSGHSTLEHTVELWLKNNLIMDLHRFSIIQSREITEKKEVGMDLYRKIHGFTWLAIFAITAAKVARGSYLNHLERSTLVGYHKTYGKLVISKPEHASPTEHIAMDWELYQWLCRQVVIPRLPAEQLNGNFAPGIVQWRKLIEYRPSPPSSYAANTIA